MIKKCLVILILLSGAVLAQEAKKADVWEPLRFFAGDWEGTGIGPSGSSKIFTKFEFVLGGKYLQVINRAVFEPQEKNPEGEIHEDLGLVSYDGARQKFVFRQFHIEGYVNQYVLDSLSPDGKMLVFVSESLENAPPAMKAKVTWQITGDDECRILFDLAMPGKEFMCFSENQLQRKK